MKKRGIAPKTTKYSEMMNLDQERRHLRAQEYDRLWTG